MPASILLIDDDVDVLRSIGNYFERLGYEVTRELSGEAGLATYERQHPDVVSAQRPAGGRPVRRGLAGHWPRRPTSGRRTACPCCLQP